MEKIVITGGSGFAGSIIVDRFRERFPTSEIVVFDRMTYASDFRNLNQHVFSDRIRLVVADVAELDSCMRIVAGADLVVHAAAESHVDNSFGNSREFTRTNVLGTHCLVEACRVHKVPKIIHISTDEVYGEVMEGAANEAAVLDPTNPYSASKAAAEMIIRGYQRSFGTPILTVRANNLYGIRQYPEKIIPRFICQMLLNRKMPLHGAGRAKRHYLSARDFADAVVMLSERGTIGEIYNIGSSEEYTNLQVAEMIARSFGENVEEVTEFVADRPFNDSRYSITWDKIRRLGWMPRRSLATDIPGLIDWYDDNLQRYTRLLNVPPEARRGRALLLAERAA